MKLMLRKLNSNINLRRPQAIFFDTDDTLYPYAPANQIGLDAVEKKIMNLLGVSPSLFRKSYIQARSEIKTQLGCTASSHSRLLYFQRVIEILGFRADLLTALDLEQTFWRTFLASAPIFPGVTDLLDYLRSNNIPIAIVTDLTSQIQLRKLCFFNLETTFDAVVTSEEVGADKPDRRNFDLTLRKLGLDTYNRIWMVGDNPDTDIKGGKSVGAITFQKIHSTIKIGEGNLKPDYVFSSFHDLFSLVKKTVDNELY